MNRNQIITVDIVQSSSTGITSEPIIDTADLHDAPALPPVSDSVDFQSYSPEKMQQIYNSCIKIGGQAEYLYTKLKGAEKSFGQLQMQLNDNAAVLIALQSELEEQKIEVSSIQSKLENKDVQILELEQQLKKLQESKGCNEDRIEALALQITQYTEFFLTKSTPSNTTVAHTAGFNASTSGQGEWVTIQKKSNSTSNTPSKDRGQQSTLSYKDKLMLNRFAPLLKLSKETDASKKAPQAQQARTVPAASTSWPSRQIPVNQSPPPPPPFHTSATIITATPPPPPYPPPRQTLNQSSTSSAPPTSTAVTSSTMILNNNQRPPQHACIEIGKGRFHNRSLCAVGTHATNREAMLKLQGDISQITRVPINDMHCSKIRSSGTPAIRILFHSPKMAGCSSVQQKERDSSKTEL